MSSTYEFNFSMCEPLSPPQRPLCPTRRLKIERENNLSLNPALSVQLDWNRIWYWRTVPLKLEQISVTVLLAYMNSQPSSPPSHIPTNPSRMIQMSED